MAEQISLTQFLASWSQNQSDREAIAAVIECITDTAIVLADVISQQAFNCSSPDTGMNADGDMQKPLDLIAHQLFEQALINSPAKYLASEEQDGVIALTGESPLAVAIDPLDGSSNIDTNLSIGSIFSIVDLPASTNEARQNPFIGCTGNDQLAAGFVVFGPQTILVLSCCNGTHAFALKQSESGFMLLQENIRIPSGRREFAINASNYHHWDSSIRGYVDDCIAGQAGPREADFNMRWAASLVAEAYRIFVRGGIFLYPADARPKYHNGRLRLLYEAFPIALLIEQAGGAASDGRHRIMDKQVDDLHQRIPLVFGSSEKVDRVARYYLNPPREKNHYPLFEPRSLLRS